MALNALLLVSTLPTHQSSHATPDDAGCLSPESPIVPYISYRHGSIGRGQFAGWRLPALQTASPYPLSVMMGSCFTSGSGSLSGFPAEVRKPLPSSNSREISGALPTARGRVFNAP